MNIDDWIKLNGANFGSEFELEFAVKVLAKTSGIDLNTVSTQYHFKDLDGKNRYCDFVIQEGLIKIAIEIDGFSKKPGETGMSHDDFVDWQRRQAALTALGWYVLRFANRDVVNEPVRCQRYIELLLREQRSKSQHQANLEEAIGRLNAQLKVARGNINSGEQANKLQREINLLKNQLELAQSAKPLDSSDKNELKQLVGRLEQENKQLIAAHNKIKEENAALTTSNASLKEQKQFLDGENDTMKTTIWAFVAVLGILVMAGTYILTRNSATQAPPLVINAVPAQQQMETQRSVLTTQVNQAVDVKPRNKSAATSSISCDSPIDWQLAKNHAEQLVAVRGTVKEYQYLPNVKGAPTWINLGAKYPAKERLAVVVWGNDRDRFGRALSEGLVNRQICIIGKVRLHNGTPQIAIKWPRELVFQ